MNINIKNNKFKIIVIPNSKENKLKSFDKLRNAYILHIKARPENNKANIACIKFLSKMLRKRVRLFSGLSSREKIIEVID